MSKTPVAVGRSSERLVPVQESTGSTRSAASTTTSTESPSDSIHYARRLASFAPGAIANERRRRCDPQRPSHQVLDAREREHGDEERRRTPRVQGQRRRTDPEAGSGGRQGLERAQPRPVGCPAEREEDARRRRDEVESLREDHGDRAEEHEAGHDRRERRESGGIDGSRLAEGLEEPRRRREQRTVL